MKKIFSFILSLSILLVIISLPHQAQAASLDTTVKKQLGSSGTSVTVRSAKTGNIIYSLNGDVARQTASNMKLVTGATALGVLGEDFRYTTDLYIDGTVKGSVLTGDVYVKGSGDPTLQYKDLQTIAKQLKESGIKTLKGQVYVDDTLFSDSTLPPGAPPNEQTHYYAARTSALHMSPNDDFDAGTIIVQVSGGTVGKAAVTTAIPHASGQVIVNKARTVKKGSGTSISVVRKYNTNQITVTGTIAAGSSVKKWVTVQDPTLATGNAFKGALKNAGISYAASTKVAKKAVPADAVHVYTHESRTLKSMFATFMKLSNNSMADTFTRTIAVQKRKTGTLSGGLKDTKTYLKTINVPSTGLTLYDGSGLSSKNKVHSNTISKLLYEMQTQPTFDAFYASLPVGGVNDRLVGGTLKSRFTGQYAGRVHAKTGYIYNVYALSGYVETKKGNTLIFSILTENKKASTIPNIDAVVKSIINTY